MSMSSNPVVQLKREDSIALVTIDNPPVNAFAFPVRVGVLEAFDKIAADRSFTAVVLACAGRTFIAGADLAEFGTTRLFQADFNDVCAAIENCTRPVVAAIHGVALGGGFEVALSCHYRIALPTAKVGFPEVTLGLLPGAGGTQRATRLIGVADALELILSGARLSADVALQKGLIDAIVEGDLREQALICARKLVADKAPLKRASAMRADPASVAPDFLAKARERVSATTGDAIAPAKIVDCVEAAVHMSFAEGMAFERACLLECIDSPQSVALRRAFFAERGKKQGAQAAA